MKSLISAALLAVGLTGIGIAAADASSVVTDPNAVIEHHNTAHSTARAEYIPAHQNPSRARVDDSRQRRATSIGLPCHPSGLACHADQTQH